MIYVAQLGQVRTAKKYSPSTEVWFGVVGRLKLCHPHVDMVLNGLNVCKPVTSTPNAKLPLPTCNGVVLELALRRTLNACTTLRLCIQDFASAKAQTKYKVRRETRISKRDNRQDVSRRTLA